MSDTPQDPLVVASADLDGPTPVPSSGSLFQDDQFPLDTRTEVPDGYPPLRFPHFNPREVGTIFFGKADAPEWHRGHRRYGKDVYPGQEAFPYKFRKGRSFSAARRSTEPGELRLTIPDVERLAHVLAYNQVIDGVALVNAVNVCISIARTYGVNPRPARPSHHS
ncbi:hypothetical protein [Kitasatospora viridis]|nr:hypothetical protein [Kitasatospora viridis]